MARPRVFVSSTYYDLKHIRSSLDAFIESLGFDTVLSEKGDIAYSPDAPLDESCFREVGSVDIFVIVIGGRYGSEASNDKRPTKEFFDRYDSITRKEYEAAFDRNIPIYILIDSSVYAEYQTFMRNQENQSIHYAHVESVNVFRLIADILAKPSNNPIQTFVRFGDIEQWLREQWAGLFRDLLSRLSGQRQMDTLSAQVARLEEVSTTLQRYLEAMMEKVAPAEATRIIAAERERLESAETIERFRANPFIQFLQMRIGLPILHIRDLLASANTLQEFLESLGMDMRVLAATAHALRLPGARSHLNEARVVLGRPPFEFPDPTYQEKSEPSPMPASSGSPRVRGKTTGNLPRPPGRRGKVAS